MAIEAIKNRFPPLNEKGESVTFPNFGSQVFGDDDEGRALWQAGKGFYSDDSKKLDGKTLDEIIPSSGTAGQVLTKVSDADNDAQWKDPISGMELVLLWENASPKSNFDAQDIELDLSQYQMVMIVCSRLSNGIPQRLMSHISLVGIGGSINDCSTNSSGSARIATRTFAASQTGISFDSGLVQITNSESRSESTTALCPNYIYGIKGVK